MALVNVHLLDPENASAGTIAMPSSFLDKAIRGERVKVPVEQLALPSGTRLSMEMIGVRPTGRDRLEFEARPNLFGKGTKWTYHTNGFGAELVRRAMRQEDADLFRFWLEFSDKEPDTVSRHLSGCTSPIERRNAIVAMKRVIDRGVTSAARSRA